MACKQCTIKNEERVRTLRKRLQSSKWRCTCGCPIHKERCKLTPVYFGERRWPGSDGFITADDRKFLDDFETYASLVE